MNGAENVQRLNVATLQRWMQTVLMHPGGVGQGIVSHEANDLLGLGPVDCEKVLTRSRALSALDRLAIYNRAYFARLVDCLRESFPVLRHAIGEEIFDEFAVGYLQSYPSRTYTLFELGKNFHRFLAETRPPASETGGDMSWPEFLIDLATLELTFNEVFDGPGSEQSPPLSAGTLRGISPEGLLKARVICTPSLRLLTFRFPVHRYWSLVRRKQEVEIPEADACHVAVYRRDFVVRHLELPGDSFALLKSLQSQGTLRQAFEAAMSGNKEIRALAASVQHWFRQWTAQGIILNIEV